MRCQFVGADHRCPYCGFVAKRRDGSPVRNLVRRCPGQQDVPFIPRLRVGDWIEAAARLLWVTPERIERWTRRPCGCRGRRDWINERSAAVSARLERAILRLLAPLRRGR